MIVAVAISLYKHPNARKGQYCVICVDRTRGPATRVRLAYGVIVHLCAEHASPAFQTKRLGRDFVLTLQRVWGAGGCLNERRHRALDAHLAAVAAANAAPSRRPRPGSYCWPELRHEAEARCARGEPAETIVRDLRRRRAPGICVAPSVRTIRRWLTERRWTFRRPKPPPTPPPAWPAGGAASPPRPSAPGVDRATPIDHGRSPPAREP
jgi:hypothetical protein